MLANAILLAAERHVHQKDKGGNPYILHPLRLMFKFQNPIQRIAAVLHDVIEDTDTTLEELANLGYPNKVLEILTLLTHDPQDTYEEYIAKIAKSRDATLIKLADLEDNSDITRLKGITDKDFIRMQKYHKAYTFLRNSLK